MATQPSTTFTRADLDDFPDDGHRYELVDGQLLVSPGARLRHQTVVMRISARVFSWTEVHGGRVYPGANVDLAPNTHLEPDVVWSSSEDESGAGFEDTPEFVVEVASPSTRGFDRGVKKDRYAATGCREFWIVDLDTATIERFEVRAGRADEPHVHHRGDRFTSPLFPGLALEVDDLLGLTA